MDSLIQILMSMLAAVGFSLIFNIHGLKVLITAIGAAVTWGAYLLLFGYTDNVFMSCLVATVISMLIAEIMARVAKTPTIILLVPMLIPMIPGGDLYHMMANLVMKNSELSSFFEQQLLMEVGGIAFGIIIVSTAFQVGKTLRQGRAKASDFSH